MDSVQHNFFEGKQCISCLEWKSFTEYRKRKDSVDGYRNQCRACKRRQDKQYVEANYERLKENWASYRESHRETQREWAKKHYVTHVDQIKEKTRDYWHRNRDSRLTKQGQYYRRNRENILAHNKQYQESRKEFYALYKRQWHQQNKARTAEGRRVIAENYRAKKRGNGGRYTIAQWRAICTHYGSICLCCRQRKPLTADHIVPVSKGGSNMITNLQPLCFPCNRRKHCRDTDYRPDKGAFAQSLVDP